MTGELIPAYPRPASPQDRGSEDALLAFLVETIHSARASLAASTVMAMATTLGAYELTGARILLVFVLAHVLIGAGRWRRLVVYESRAPEARSMSFIAACDSAFAFWSTLYALTLGLACYVLSASGGDPSAFGVGLSTCTGYTLAFVTRSSGRPWTLRLQVVGIAAPQIFALLTLPLPHGTILAVLVMGLVGAALVMARHGYSRIVALYQADEATRRMARTDMLTGLMNRFAAGQAFERATAEVQPQIGEALVVFLVDLDHFKEINDTFGHAAGDAVLAETAERLRAAAPLAAAARMGGDEFMLIARMAGADPRAVGLFGNVLVEILSRPTMIEGTPVQVGASVGAAVWPQHGREMAELMKHADCALYESKREGRGRLRLFDDTLRDRLAETRLMERELDAAMRGDQLEVWYQPIQSLRGAEVRGYEALVRWRHPTRGLVAPDRFVPLAEQNGAIFRLGEIVLEKACRQAASWDRRLSVAVNLSPRQFRRPQPLVRSVKEALASSGLAPSRLYLEITESLLMDDTPQTREAINELAEYGVKFSLDDFGAGYSSLAYIKDYPFSKIKIDRRFIQNIDTDQTSGAIVASVCALAERIHVGVVAEGVETPAQARALAELGVDLAQGYLFGRPAPMAAKPPLKLAASA